jgi:hypothetical protein
VSRPLPAGWRFEPSDVVGAMADLYPEWACWQDNQNNVHGNTSGPNGDVWPWFDLSPRGELTYRRSAAEQARRTVLPDGIASPASPASVARWAVAVATGGDLPTR